MQDIRILVLISLYVTENRLTQDSIERVPHVDGVQLRRRQGAAHGPVSCEATGEMTKQLMKSQAFLFIYSASRKKHKLQKQFLKKEGSHGGWGYLHKIIFLLKIQEFHFRFYCCKDLSNKQKLLVFFKLACFNSAN